MRNVRDSRGFTLMELMTVVAIVGVLTSIALPLYGQYVARSQASRVASELAHLRARVEECLSNGVTALGTDNSQCDMGGFRTNLVGELIATLDVNVDVIKAVFGGDAALPITGKHIGWVRNPSGVWECQTNVDSEYRPSGCAYVP